MPATVVISVKHNSREGAIVDIGRERKECRIAWKISELILMCDWLSRRLHSILLWLLESTRTGQLFDHSRCTST